MSLWTNQNNLKKEIQALKEAQHKQAERLAHMESDTMHIKMNELRDRLLENYRYFINKQHNPLQSWTRMESDAFWDLFNDYEKLNGDGYVHTVVQPAMNLLTVIDMGDDEDIAELMRTRT